MTPERGLVRPRANKSVRVKRSMFFDWLLCVHVFPRVFIITLVAQWLEEEMKM